MNADSINMDNHSIEEVYYEGKTYDRIHRSYERNYKLIKKVKKEAIKKNGSLKCEICNFDFLKTYGKIGEGYIEAPHIIPLSQLAIETQSKESDIALVCANCHRMLHRGKEWFDIDEIKKLVNLK